MRKLRRFTHERKDRENIRADLFTVVGERNWAKTVEKGKKKGVQMLNEDGLRRKITERGFKGLENDVT